MTIEHSDNEQPAEETTGRPIIPDFERLNTRTPMMNALGGAVLYLVFFTFMALFNLHPPQLPVAVWMILAPLTTVLYVLILVYTIRLLCCLECKPSQERLLMLLSLLLFMTMNPAIRDAIWLLLQHQPLDNVLARVAIPIHNPALNVLVPFFLILTGVFFGQIIAGLIRERAMLVPVALIAGMIDFWGVYWGPVGAMSASAPGAVNAMATAATAAATVPDHIKTQLPDNLQMLVNIAPPQNIGIGDFVFLAFFLTCAYRLGFSVRRTMWGIFAGLLLASCITAMDEQTIIGMRLHIEYLPGLVFICGGVLLANLVTWKLSRQEWAMTGVLVAILAGFISVSIVRAESGKIHTKHSQYLLTASTPRALFAQALTHIKMERKAPAEVLPIAVGCVFTVKHHTAQAEEWQLISLGRQPHVTLRNSREINIFGMPADKTAQSWQIEQDEQEVNNPAEKLLGLLKKHDGDDKLTLVRTATALSAEQLAVFERADAYAKQVPEGKSFAIQVLPSGIKVIDQNRKPLKSP